MAVVRCLCGRAALRFHRPAVLSLECGCCDCRQAREFAASLGGAASSSALSSLSYFPNDVSLEPLPGPYRHTMLRKDGRSTRLLTTCCHSILAVDHPNYRGNVVMVPTQSCVVEGLLPEAKARVYMKDWDRERDGPVPEAKPGIPVIRGDEPPEERAAKAETYRPAFRDTSPLPRQGVAIQDIFNAIGPLEVIGLQEAKRLPPLSS